MTGDQYPSGSLTTLNQRLNVDFALQAAGLGIWEYDPITNRVLWDERCRALFGLAADNQMSYEQAFSHVHPDDVARVDQAAQRVMDPQSDGVFDQTYRTIGVDDKKLRWVRFQGRVDFTPTGEVERFGGIAQNVTPQMLAQLALENSRQQVLNSFEQAPFAVAVLTGPELTYQMANTSYCHLVARTGEQLMGKALIEAIPEVKGQGFIDLLQQVIKTGVPYESKQTAFQVRHQHELKTAYFDSTYQPWQEDGKTTGVMIVAVEVTQQVLAQRQRADAEAQLRTIITHLPSATVVFRGRELVVETPSQNFIDIIDRGPDVEGKPLGELMPELESQSFLAILDDVFTTGQSFRAFGTPVTIHQEDGSTTRDFFDLIYTPLFDSENQVYAILSAATNVTNIVATHNLLEESEIKYRLLSTQLEQLVEQRTAELAATNEELTASNEEYAAINEELAESNGLLIRSNDNLQTFAYIASHDLQEPLRKIQQFGNLLQLREGEGKLDVESAGYVERMQVAASRMSLLIRDLLAFSRISTQRNTEELVSLTNVVGTVVSVLDLVISETNAQVIIDPLPTVSGDAVQLGQLFQNLLSNALKFRQRATMPIIRIRSQLVAASQLPSTVQPTRRTDTYHLIQVVDNGIGFEEKYLDRIFQVFQRLHGKSQYAGTGVGLAICEKVVVNHGGVITASSRPGHGATFSVYLPV